MLLWSHATVSLLYKFCLLCVLETIYFSFSLNRFFSTNLKFKTEHRTICSTCLLRINWIFNKPHRFPFQTSSKLIKETFLCFGDYYVHRSSCILNGFVITFTVQISNNINIMNAHSNWDQKNTTKFLLYLFWTATIKA